MSRSRSERTALDACQSGFLRFVVLDARGDRHAAPHEADLFDLQANYVEVVSEARVLEHMAATARR